MRALQEEIRRKDEELEKLNQALPHEAVRERIVRRPVADERWIDQEKAAPKTAPAAPAVRRKTPRIALSAISAITLIALLAYILRNFINSTNDKAAFDWHGSYANAPNDGSAWVEKPGRGSDRVIRGGSWGENGGFCRSAAREASAPGNRSAYNGFRLARTYR
ncbi:MAG TPA: SUMF1/EgtB/PvdO family nonheme iron enzyme [Blastocatellia bacterium]|jgi:hypothetical protein|nr:SUMF1/EgtB/PvdO family nonheme iron enzyme [Blastocatellia bacterium]